MPVVLTALVLMKVVPDTAIVLKAKLLPTVLSNSALPVMVKLCEPADVVSFNVLVNLTNAPVTVSFTVKVVGPPKVTLLLPPALTLPDNTIEPVPLVWIVTGVLKVTAFTVVAAVLVLRPMIKLLKPFAIAATSVAVICNVPLAPATPTVVASVWGCN